VLRDICCACRAHNSEEEAVVTETSELNATFHFIMEWMVATGQAPDPAQIAVELGVTPVEGQKALRDLFSSFGFPGWLYPNRDAVMSFPPFNVEPTNHRVTIDGEQKWFAQ